MPSREHFLLNLLIALSTDSFSPTLIVDMPFNPPSPTHLFPLPFSGSFCIIANKKLIVKYLKEKMTGFLPIFHFFYNSKTFAARRGHFKRAARLCCL